ncbi:MAG: preprotein translocase subunit YajC [Gemmatimonadaceae bacterium]|jgi:preprotein translocase subunit YajC|nr:preprotein translocase subunit YajC [Gemmatimonadaceae bacterium]
MAFPVPFALLALQQGGLQSMLPFLFQIAAFFAIFYFIVLRPQQKERKRHQERLLGLKKGDEIVTAGGLVGEVAAIQQGLKDGQPTPSLEDRITIKSGESKVVVQRGRIAAVLGDGGTSVAAT